ncbi:MAG: lipopolysaccharide biosynthesis protein [Clostridiaceae bacterium]|nr:lipopolysaccharide biosynthesis protein [Clostridiaceae bacterium]
MTSLKQKTVSGLTWSFSGDIIDKAIVFVVGIILARLLSPREYGLVGMVTIFIVLTQPFINSGFSQALIRKQDCTETDFSTVFYFNLVIGVLLYFILFFTAPFISAFFKEPQLTKITRVIGLIIVIDAATLIQTTILTKEINFKRQTQITISSTLISGVLGISLAYNGYGVWSLVFKTIAFHGFKSALLWYQNRWKPILKFSWTSFKQMFGFGSNLLISAILDKVYYNIYNLVIAKFFSARDLGLYSRADMFKNMIAVNISEVAGRVSFPVLAKLQNESDSLSVNYKKILTSIMFITSILLISIAASAEPLILTLIGEKWIDSIAYLQLLCFVGIFYPLHVMTRTLLFVYGKSRMFLKLQIVTKMLSVPAIILGIIYGIKIMIIAMIAASAIEYLIKAFYSGRIVGYPVGRQLKDLMPGFIIAIFIGSCLFFLDFFLHAKPIIILIIQICLGIILTIFLSKFFRIPEFKFIVDIIDEKIKGLKRKC